MIAHPDSPDSGRPLDILYLADIRFPLERANGIQSFETCHALATLGHRVTLVVRDDTHQPRRDPFEFYGLPPLPNLLIVRLPMAGPYVLRRVYYMAAVVFATVTFPRSGCVFTRDLGVADVIQALPAWARPPMVYESHGFAPVFSKTLPELVDGHAAGGQQKIERLIRRERRVWAQADGYVATTGVLAAELRSAFGDREHVVTLSNGVRLPADRHYEPLTASGPAVVAYAGHLYAWKGVDTLIRALPKLPDVHALLIGGFPGEHDLARLQSLARELRVDGRVRFAGLVKPSLVPAMLGEARVLVLPTVATESAAYTSPLKLFEYFAAGRPVVASDLPSVREIVRDGENGLLFEAGNEDALAAAVTRVLRDTTLADSLARAAFADAEHYGWSRRAERLATFLSCVARPARSPRGLRHGF
jgi:glycosyltransferase involved in cell wall biosynthesis